MDKKLLLSFKGDKKEVHRKLKELCAKQETTMNKKIIDLIEQEIYDKTN